MSGPVETRVAGVSVFTGDGKVSIKTDGACELTVESARIIGQALLAGSLKDESTEGSAPGHERRLLAWMSSQLDFELQRLEFSDDRYEADVFSRIARLDGDRSAAVVAFFHGDGSGCVHLANAWGDQPVDDVSFSGGIIPALEALLRYRAAQMTGAGQ